MLGSSEPLRLENGQGANSLRDCRVALGSRAAPAMSLQIVITREILPADRPPDQSPVDGNDEADHADDHQYQSGKLDVEAGQLRGHRVTKNGSHSDEKERATYLHGVRSSAASS